MLLHFRAAVGYPTFEEFLFQYAYTKGSTKLYGVLCGTIQRGGRASLFEDLEPSQLHASILGGSLVLRNLKLKADALAALSIPVDIAYGHIGRLEIKLNLLRLLTGPIVLKAEDVLVVGTTQPPSAWNVEREELLRDQQRNLTLLTDECLTYAREESGLPSVLQRAAYAIIQRIRLSVTRLEVRLEDTETAAGQHFAFGLRATRLYNVRCDSNWEAKGQPSTASPTSEKRSTSQPPASNGTSCQSWFEWLKSFGGWQANNEPSEDKIPEAFHLKTVMEDACLYLDAINNGNEQASWLPYSASYREAIIRDLQNYLVLNRHSSSAKQVTPWSIIRRPKQGEGQGIASVLPVSTLSEIVLARRRQSVAIPGSPLSRTDEKGPREAGIIDKEAANSKFQPPAPLRTPEATEVGPSYDADQQEKSYAVLRFSDLYCPEVLWQIANRTAPHHMYILKPVEVELRVRCVQRPTAPSTGSEKSFPRPSPATSYLRSTCDDACSGPELKEVESGVEARATADLEKEPLPALTVIIVSRNSLLQFTTFQVACIFRWLHYAIFLYQELVSGVYAECLELTPTEDEMAKYRSAWRRHLMSYAVTATNSGNPLNLRINAGQCTVPFTSPGCVEPRNWEDQKAVDEQLIQEFEAKYWPTVILPLRQLALQDLKQKVCCGQSGRMATSHQRYGVGGGAPASQGEQADRRMQRGDADTVERVIASSSNEILPESARELVEEMADEVSMASAAELQMIKCIQQMQPCRFSKSVQFAVQLYGLEVTLAAAYEAPACIRVKCNELYAHNAMYYDLRMQLVAACDGLQITDSLTPNLSHRRVLVSRSRAKSYTEAHRFAEPCKGLHRDTLTEGSISASWCASCGSKHIHGTPPLSPLQPVNSACILDWSTNCARQGGCPLEPSRKEHEDEMVVNQDVPAGGWIRFDKSFVPLEGIPDMRLYLQTYGSLLCTITPAAVANLVKALCDQPMHLVEGSSILEAASREVQDALHRNELFLAQLLVGEVDHPTIDVCVDVPVSHKLLVPFSHDTSQCRGVLFQSGVVSVDSRLKLSQQKPFATGPTCIRKEYDRYSIIITGACLQRVINCQQVECSPSACQKYSCSPLSGKTDAAKRCSAALTEIVSKEVCSQNISSSAGAKRRRWEQLHTNSAARRHKESLHGSTDNRLEVPGRPSNNESDEGSSRLGRSEFLVDGISEYIMWPAGLIANIDVCNNLHGLSDLPAFAIILQDQDFSGVSITLTDKDIVAFSGFLAQVQGILQIVAPLWNAPPVVDDDPDLESISSTSSATLPSTERKESCSTKSHLLESLTRTRKFQDRILRRRGAADFVRLHSSRTHRRTIRNAASGGLSDYSGKDTIESFPNAGKSSTLRRVAFYLHRSLHNSGVPPPSQSTTRKRATHMLLLSRMQQAGPSFPDDELSALDDRNSTNLLPTAANVPNGDEVMRENSVFEDVENKSDQCLALESEYSGAAADDMPESSEATQHTANQKVTNGLIGFDVKLGLSIFEFRLYKEKTTAALETITTGPAEHAGSSTGGRQRSLSNSVLLRCTVGNSSMRLNCPAHSTCTACVATVDEVCVSLGRLAPADAADPVPSEARGGRLDFPKGTSDIGSQHYQRNYFSHSNWSAESCAASGPAHTGRLAMDSDPSGSGPTVTPAHESWSVPLFHFMRPHSLSRIDAEEAAADVATALSEAASFNGQSSKMMLPSATVTALRRALASKQLRLTTRWMFPPLYPGTQQPGDYRTEKIQESPREVEEQCSKYKPAASGSACGASSTAYDTACGGTADSGGPQADVSSLLSRLDSHNKDAAEQEVLVEDLAGGRCFFIPACLHAAIAPRKSWQVLAKKVPAVCGEASICLKALIHSLEVRCIPLRITVDWGIISEHIGLAGEVASEASKAYVVAPRRSASGKPEVAAPPPTCPPCLHQRFSDVSSEADEYPAGHTDNGDTDAYSKWNGDSQDVVLFMQNGGKLPWRVRVSILVSHCDVVVPTSTPSPYPNFPLSPALCGEGQLLWEELTPSTPMRRAPRRRSLLEAPAVSRRVQPRSSLSSHHLEFSAKTLHGLDSNVGSFAASRYSGRNRGTDAERPSKGGAHDLLEAIVATAPPLYVFSFSVSTSFYSECHSLVHMDDADSCIADPGSSHELARRTPIGQTTLRLLANVDRLHAELLQGPGGSDKGSVHLTEVLRRLLGHTGPETAGRPPLGCCLRPIGFGAADVPLLTLLDAHRVTRSLSYNARNERSASTVQQLIGEQVLDAPFTSSPTQTRTFRSSVEASSKGRPSYQTPLIVQKHGIIDGCRCRVSATYRMAVECTCKSGKPPLRRNEQHASESMRGAYRQKTNYSKNDGEALVELEPLLVHMEPPVVVAGLSLLQLLQKLFLPSPPTASDLQKQTAEAQFGQKEADGSARMSGISGTAATTDLKRRRTSVNAEPYVEAGAQDIGQKRPHLTAASKGHQKYDQLPANASFVAASSLDGVGKVQSSFETAESSIASSVAENLPSFVDIPVNQGFYQCIGGSSPASRSKGSSLEYHSESRHRTTAALEETAEDNEEAENALAWFWNQLNALDAVLILKIRMECIQLESPSLHFTVEDLEVRCGLESVAGRFSLKRLPAEAVYPRAQRPSIRGQQVRQPNSKSPGKSSGSLKEVAKEQKEFTIGIKMMLSAEALHKERIALESILEPWYCSVDLRYTPGDLLMKTLLAYSPGEKDTMHFTERPTAFKRAMSVWASGTHAKDIKTRDGRQRSLLLHPKPEKKTKYMQSSSYYRGSEGDSAAAETRKGLATHNYYSWARDASNRSRKLQQLARTWGKYGTELCAEVYCSWLNVTAAPFLMDAVLDTANLIETAQRALQEQLNKQEHLRIALRSGASISPFQQSKAMMKHTGYPTRNVLIAAAQRNSGTHALPEGNSETEAAAIDAGPENKEEGLRPSSILSGADSTTGKAAQTYLENENVSAGPVHPTHPPAATRPHGAVGSFGEDVRGHPQNNVAMEEQPLPMLVNMTGLPLLVHVPSPERRSSDARGEESNSLILDHHLVTDGFGIMRRKAFATIPLVASNSSTASEGTKDDENECSNSFEGSASNVATNVSQFKTSPGTEAGTENTIGGWRSLCHGESFHLPLDDHGQTRKVIVRLQIAGSEFEIDDLSLDGSQVSVRELPIKLPTLLNSPLQRDARKKQRHELLRASARILVFPHPAVAVIDTPAEGSSSASSSCTVGGRWRCEAPKSPSIQSSPKENTDTINVPSSPVNVEYSEAESLVQDDIQDPTSHEHSDASSESTSRRTSSSDTSRGSETASVSPCCPLNIQENGGVVHIPLSWVLPRAVVAHRLGYLGLDRTHEGSFAEPRDSPGKLDPPLCTPKPDGTPVVNATDSKKQPWSSLFFWRHKNPTDQTNRGAAVMTVPLTNIKIHGKVSGTRAPRAASSDEVEAFPNFYKSVIEKWKDDMAVEPLYIIPSSCIASELRREEHDAHYERSSGCDSNPDTFAQQFMFQPKATGSRMTAESRRCLISLLSNKQPSPPDYDAQGMGAKGYYDLYSLVRSLGAKPLLEHATLQQIALETSHSIIAFDCRPQVLEFFYRSTPTTNANTDARGDPIISTLGHPTQLEVHCNEGSSVVSTAVAVTVYGQSRDLVSESDPLFFEVGLNAPVSLGNRLFEPLRVSAIPTNSTTVQRHPGGAAAPDHQDRLLPFARIAAGGDIDVQRASRGFVFELETTACGSEYRHIYESKPLLIDCHAPAPASAVDLTVCFVRSRILDSSGNRIQQHSALYRHLSRHQPTEFSVQAEVLGWVQQNASSSNGGPSDSASSCDLAGLTNIQRHMWCTCVRMVRIFAPFWLVNRQPEALAVSYCRRPIQYMPSFDWRLLGVPSQGKAYLALGIVPDDEAAHLFLQKDCISPALAEDIKAARSRRGPTAKLSPAFRVDIVGRPSTVSVQMQSSGEDNARGMATKSRHFGVHVALAPPPFSRSRIISIHSRFILKNCLPYDIWVKETNGNAPPLRLEPGYQCAFHPQALGPRGEALICITKTDPAVIKTLGKTDATATAQAVNLHPDGFARMHSLERVVWSSQLSIARSASFQIRLKTPVEPLLGPAAGGDQHTTRGVHGKGGRSISWEHHNIHIAIRSRESAAYAVVFSEPSASEYLLVNNTNHIIAFAQSGIRSKYIWEILDRGSQVDYAWTDPQRERKHLRFSFWDQNQKVVKACDIARVRLHRPLNLPNSKEKVYFVTDVCGSRRRVTVTLDAPSASMKNSLGARKVWKNLQHDLLKIHRKKVQPLLKRETKAFALARPHSQAGVRLSVSEGRKSTVPIGDRQLLGIGRERRRRETEKAPPDGSASQENAHQDPLPQRKMLRFQKRETLKLAFNMRSGSPACSGSSSSESSLSAEDTAANAEPNAPSGSGESQGAEGVNETLRRHRMTTFLSRRSVINASGSRTLRPNFKRKGNRLSYELSQRSRASSTSSEMNQVEEPSKGTSFLEIGFYGGILIQGFGISLVDPTPHELAFFCVSGIRFEVGRLHKASVHDIRFSIKSLQIDNGVPGAQHRTILRHATLEERVERHGESKLVFPGDGSMTVGASEGSLASVAKPLTAWDSLEESQGEKRSPFFRLQLGGQWRDEATLLDYVDVELTPIALHVEADTTSVLLRFLMQLVQNRTFFLLSLQEHNIQLVQDAAANKVNTPGYQQLRAFPQTTVRVEGSLKPLYIHELAIRPMLIIFSTRSQRVQSGHATAGQGNMVAIRQFEVLGDRMTDITNFPMKSRLLVQQCVFTNAEQLVTDIGSSYIQQCIWQLHKLVASIDVIGNPLRLITGVSSSLRLATAHHSDEDSNSEPKAWMAFHCASTLVLNFASEFFTSISNISGGLVKLLQLLGLTDVQGILSVWPETIRVPRIRLERPETVVEGIYAGCIGFVQLIGGSVLGLRQIYDQSAVESGAWRLCIGAAQRLAFVLASPAVAILVLIGAVAAGLSSTLRHKYVVEKVRPRRVFPPEMTVSQYRLHTARAMTLLEASTQKSLVPGMLQSGIISFPLPQTRSLRSRRQQHDAENNKNQVKDYLLVTSDFLVCLRDGKAQWVCRKEDIQECTVSMPAYVLGALLAQQDLFVRNRERPEAANTHDEGPHRTEDHERAAYEQGNLCVVHVKVANQLRLPETILHNFSAAYKAYLRHATARRSVVQAIRENFKVRFGTSEPSVTRSRRASEAQGPHQLNRTTGPDGSDGAPPFLQAVASSLSHAKSVPARSGPPPDQGADHQDRVECGNGGGLQEPQNKQQGFSLLGLLTSGRFCWKRKNPGNPGNNLHAQTQPRLWTWWDWLRFKREKPSEPEAVTFTVRAPDREVALQVFDALCSATECYFRARQQGGANAAKVA
ncbi:AGAP005082-PA, related, related [Eimeria brunetti]|uniref:AGAP005082-PA, related, related n=1 Tax=Eimeria brunetti TaxID=51314 RepID=U6LPM7_9EIME|nr:AGAP005082-PA, related, related [Eimeria brunetti]